MQRIILARQQFHVAVALQVDVGLHRRKGRAVAGGQHIIEAGQLVVTGLLDVVAGTEAVENQLAQFNGVAGTAPALRTDARHVVAIFPAQVALRVDLREERCTGNRLAFQRRLKVVVLRLNFGIAEQGLLDDLIQRHCGGAARGGSRRCGSLGKCSGNKGQGKNRSRAFEQKRSHSDYSRVRLK
ncbi:hypothetical protein D3C73_747380 [compost metagenome]